MAWGTGPTYVGVKVENNTAKVSWSGISPSEVSGYYVTIDRVQATVYSADIKGGRYNSLGYRIAEGYWSSHKDFEVELNTAAAKAPYVVAVVTATFSYMATPSGTTRTVQGDSVASIPALWENGYNACSPVGPSIKLNAVDGEMKVSVTATRNTDQVLWSRDSVVTYTILPLAQADGSTEWQELRDKVVDVTSNASASFDLQDAVYQSYKRVKFKCLVLTTNYPEEREEQYGPESVTIKRNSPPQPPNRILPPSVNGYSYNPNKAFIRFQAGEDSDGTAQKYRIKCNGATSAELSYRGYANFVTDRIYEAYTNDGVIDSPSDQGVIPCYSPPWDTLGAFVSAEEPVLAEHLAQLRTGVDHVRHYYGLSAVQYTDQIITPRETVIKAVHLTELQAALNEVLTTYRTDIKVTWETVAPNGRIKASHINQLRGVIEQL